MSDISNIVSSFKLQDKLNPKIWYLPNEKFMGDPNGQKYEMRPEVRARLLEVAYDYIESLDVDIVVSDILMTGSLANFNWSKYSDVDIHIVADYNQFPKDTQELYDELFRMKKTIYGLKRNVTIFGYDVELYVEDENIPRDVKNVGRFSLLMDDWITYPTKKETKINYKSIKEKAKKWMDIIDGVIENVEDEDIETAKKIIKKYTTKIRKFRECGLEKGGEYSEENLVFKILRRNGYLEKIKTLKNKLVDKKLTLKEGTTNIGGVFKTDLENGPKNHGSRAFGNWQSDNAWDVFAPAGTLVNSYTKGKVSKIRDTGKNSGKVYGTQVSIKGIDGYPDIFYTHLKNVELKPGDEVNVGDRIGDISEWTNNNNMTHVHIGLPYGKHLRDLLKNSEEIFAGKATTSKESYKEVQTKFLNPVNSTNISSKFGPRWGKKHSGIDIAVPSGTNVISPANGIVVDSEIRNNSCGGTLFIDHGNGLKSRYCHLKKIDVKKGDTIAQGDSLGLTGGAKGDIGRGNSGGAHLHFELYDNGKPVDPEPYIKGSKTITTIEPSSTETPTVNTGTITQDDLINLFSGTIGSLFKQ